jgi:hypothetical protein
MTYLPGGSLLFPAWNWNGMLASMSPTICASALVGYIVNAKTQATNNGRKLEPSCPWMDSLCLVDGLNEHSSSSSMVIYRSCCH